MSHEEIDVLFKLRRIEALVEEQDNSTEQLKGIVEELRDVVRDLDKSIAIQSEKHSHMNYRVEQLQKELELLEASGDKTRSKHQDLVEKALMVFLGGLITFIFNLASKQK